VIHHSGKALEARDGFKMPVGYAETLKNRLGSGGCQDNIFSIKCIGPICETAHKKIGPLSSSHIVSNELREVSRARNKRILVDPAGADLIA
jgi:hypothetical protein